MEYPHLYWVLCVFLCLAKAYVSNAIGVTPEEADEILAKHNYYRGNVYKYNKQPKAAAMMKMVWDDDLAFLAQQWAHTCLYEHDRAINRKIPGLFSVGQNLAYSSHYSWAHSIQAWQREVNHLKYGKKPKKSAVIGHYTQMVWDTTSHLGCGYAFCNQTRHYYVCNYGPAGNFMNRLYTPYVSSETQGSSCGSSLEVSSGLCDCEGKICHNGGKLHLDTCECKCPAGITWMDDVCNVVCDLVVDNYICASKGGGWPVDYCDIYGNVKYQYCPITCGLCTYDGIHYWGQTTTTVLTSTIPESTSLTSSTTRPTTTTMTPEPTTTTNPTTTTMTPTTMTTEPTTMVTEPTTITTEPTTKQTFIATSSHEPITNMTKTSNDSIDNSTLNNYHDGYDGMDTSDKYSNVTHNGVINDTNSEYLGTFKTTIPPTSMVQKKLYARLGDKAQVAEKPTGAAKPSQPSLIDALKPQQTCSAIQPAACGQPSSNYWPDTFCMYDSIRMLCPAMCGICLAEQCMDYDGTVYELEDQWLTLYGRSTCSENGVLHEDGCIMDNRFIPKGSNTTYAENLWNWRCHCDFLFGVYQIACTPSNGV
ncbi:unnamed protein product [Owenia fusiformis]|uniref:Uncharacterized protein n=1 Tax=Owenia fusiformis TaxID=6347 RepID=A0A8J1TBD2_OWEFU|nr:unnamed protein product [Owenia fusiformis]